MSQEKYFSNAVKIAEFPIHYTDGYLFISVPVIDTDVYRHPITLNRSFILDPASSNEGAFMPDDSLIVVTGARRFYFPVSPQRTITADLVPTMGKAHYKLTDTSFFGVLGYGFLRRYLTVIDFRSNSVTLYSPSESEIQWSKELGKSSIIVPYVDDAIQNHCNCQYPTMWFEGSSKFLKDGHVHFSLGERQSAIYTQALSPKTQKFFENKWVKDSLAGKPKEPERIEVETFEIGGNDIAKKNPRRVIADPPVIFKNLNIVIMGNMAIDVIRMFHSVIIDPERSRVIFVN